MHEIENQKIFKFRNAVLQFCIETIEHEYVQKIFQVDIQNGNVFDTLIR